MNPVEIEEAISELAAQPFDAAEFPFAFIEAFNGKPTTIKRLRSGSTNKSDLDGVLRHDHIHIKTCALGEATGTLQALRESPATKKAKAKFILATDGEELQAEEVKTGDILVCPYRDFPAKFGFFLTLAGISSIPQLKESSFDIKATGLLNKLYLLLKADNPDWDTDERRHDMNHFMARLIFLFFAEDTSILQADGLFTTTVGTMSARDSSDTHEIISELFRAMNTAPEARKAANLKAWATNFPYVNGGLFEGSTEAPKFSKIARSYLLNIGGQDWTKINPDIFGSMIQAVTDDDERSSLGMHYTSVPNILKVLNPLFLDDLRAKLAEAGDNKRKLKNLRDRMSKIRVFDPACGSGNFLVIAYKEMREIEAKINAYSGEPDRRTEIPLTNFRGIELRDFPAEIARLALIIAEYQCDVTYRGQKDALAEFLPLDSENWITCDNALHLDWVSFMDVEGKGVQFRSDDLFRSPLDQAKIDFENAGGEVFICGNPPYKGTKNQSKAEKEDLKSIFDQYTKRSGSLDYVCGWFLKAAEFAQNTSAEYAFVTTNSICQGGQVPVLWPILYQLGADIKFAYHSFKWRNLASHNAVVTVAIVGATHVYTSAKKKIFHVDDEGKQTEMSVDLIGPYLIPGSKVIVEGRTTPLADLTPMQLGNAPYDGGHLILKRGELDATGLTTSEQSKWLRDLWGSTEIINGTSRKCIWVANENRDEAVKHSVLGTRIRAVEAMRAASSDAGTRSMAARPHQFREMNSGTKNTIGIPIRSSENREYLPVDSLGAGCCITNLAYAIYDGPLSNLAVIASRLHLVWIGSVCGRMKTDFSYSNKMGWHTFPMPKLTEKNKADLTRCAEDILLAREAHFPATIADLYKPDAMPDDLRAAHDRNDKVIEQMYIGRRFKNDTERLEHLFKRYTDMTTKAGAGNA